MSGFPCVEMEGKAFYQSPAVLAAIASVAGGIVGFSHFLCLYFSFCVLEQISEAGWTLFLGSALAIYGGVYALLRRIRQGKDPQDPALPITLLPPKKEN